MKRALVIVDAWKYHDTRNQEKEANALCSFLNYVIQHERQKETTIIYSFGSVPLDTAKDPHNNKINSDSLNVNIVSPLLKSCIACIPEPAVGLSILSFNLDSLSK